ncbi:hypothetical protein HYG81_07600 [Natrinema zhouii]|uniref:Halobacterial output domain-containing protein n=1 Tax=Natrinema zhouii TaxID=1710539 RepID=A0A7D6CRU1_9EURY|nr:HalOD1 output domain-containing protein [Natrinema zhouii]QLK27454.1 hypothetical protein HYG81_07600 [Natrinema zhouii]
MDSQSSDRSSVDETAPVSIGVVEAVAARDGVDPLELSPPLHDVIDPTALDALFEPTKSGNRTSGTVSFTYRGHRIHVDSDGQVSLETEREGDRQTTKNSVVQSKTESR